jgi:hypothetical protein
MRKSQSEERDRERDEPLFPRFTLLLDETGQLKPRNASLERQIKELKARLQICRLARGKTPRPPLQHWTARTATRRTAAPDSLTARVIAVTTADDCERLD